MNAVRDGLPAPCSGHDYRQVLEIAAAINQGEPTPVHPAD
jgi:hypothetical protein